MAHALLRAVSPLLATPGFWGFNALGYQSFRTTRVVIERWLCTTVVFNGSANAIEEVDVDRSELLLKIGHGVLPTLLPPARTARW